MIKLGVVQQITRYPVKSMAGMSMDSADLGLHGFVGDRRVAIRRTDDQGGFPWLSASRLPELVLYRPLRWNGTNGEAVPSHVRTPSGEELELRGQSFRAEISRRAGVDVEVMTLKNGVFDDADVSVISSVTVDAVCREAGVPSDARRFRANIVLDTGDSAEFLEEQWIGGSLLFGGSSGPRISVTAADVRCMMINLDPDSARQDPGVLKSVVRQNNNIAGVYGSVLRAGTLTVGQDVFFIEPDAF
jgi:uncharacterized protein